MPVHLPYFKFYVADFLSDDKVSLMTTEEVGAYILLLCKAWHQDEPGTLPDDDKKLAKWAGVRPSKWSKIKATVMGPFRKNSEKSFWEQKRMREEFFQTFTVSHKRSEAGRKGGRPSSDVVSVENGVKNHDAGEKQLLSVCLANEKQRESNPYDYESISKELSNTKSLIGDRGVGKGGNLPDGSEELSPQAGSPSPPQPPPARPPDLPQEPSARLSQLWCWTCTRRNRVGQPDDLPAKIEPQIRELLRIGHTEATLERLITDKSRNRNEQFFQFQDRLKPPTPYDDPMAGVIATKKYLESMRPKNTGPREPLNFRKRYLEACQNEPTTNVAN